jgi:hypothetical protein
MISSNESLKLGSLINSGICSVSGTLVTASFTDASLNNFISINSNIYKIIAYINPTTVQIDASLSLSNVAYQEYAPYTLEDDLNYNRTDRANIKGNSYSSAIPTYKRPTDTTSNINTNLSNIAGKTTDAKTILDTIKYSLYLGTVSSFSIPVTKIANSTDITGVPVFDGYDAGNIIATFVELYDSSWSSLKSSDGYFVFGRTKTSLTPNNVDVEIRKFDGINHNISYPHTIEQAVNANIYYPYRERLDLLDEDFLRKRFINCLSSGSSGTANHETLDTLVHDIAEDGYTEVTYLGNQISSYIFWTSPAKTIKVREYVLEYTGLNISKVTSIQYNEVGVEVSRLEEDVLYNQNKIVNIISNKTGDPSGGAGSGTSSGLNETDHEKLRQLIHFVDEGPANGFVSGAYKETIGIPFPSQEIWWESSSKLKKIVEVNIIRNSKKQPTNIQWLMYNSDGSLKNSVTDTINYNGIFEQNRTRAIT